MSNNRSIFIDKDHDISIKLQEHYLINPYVNKRYYGVTKVLSETKSEEDKASLQKWRDSVGEEKAEQIFQEAMAIGTSLDMILEKYLCSEFEYKMYSKETGIKLFYQVKPVIDKIVPIGTQIHLYSDKYKIQGYLDCIGYYKDTLTMIDFKNSKRRKDDKYLNDYFLQATMYCILLYEMTGILIKDISIILAIRNDAVPQIAIAKVKDYVIEAKQRMKLFSAIKHTKKES